MSPLTLARLSLAGTRVDTVRVALTALSAALAALSVLAALNVLAIGPLIQGHVGSDRWAQQYSSALLREPGLRPGVILTFVLLTVPVFALAGQCVRLGAPARDRRLAAIRLAGATPRQAVTVAAAETGIAALIGSGLGLLVYLGGHRLLDKPDAQGKLALPTDVLPPVGLIAAGVAAIPIVAALAAALVMRRVTVGPLGVVRKARRERPPAIWAGLVLGIGIALFTGLGPIVKLAEKHKITWIADWLPVLVYGGALMAAFGVVLGTGWLSYTTGRVLHRYARRPAPLLAGSRLMADPWSGSRTLAVLLVCVVFAGGVAWTRSWFAAEDRIRVQYQRMVDPLQDPQSDPFYLNTVALIDLAVLIGVVLAALGMLVALADGILTRRRAYAALVATGVPRPVLARSILWQAVAPAVPAILVALTVGAGLMASLAPDVTAGGGGSATCIGTEEQCRTTPVGDPTVWRYTEEARLHHAVPVPWAELARDGGIALAAVLAIVAIGLLFLRASTDLEEIRVT
ncbi:FtsX-like permease family protein [Dactylosporangium sp. AC04546]|uniref:FtsX-like permease family protein n=1 Tax=Dactylosporangium sp. AC04546 TaxID=2862460 RepID=UPI001EDFEE1E|nr:FtsX-like permease family protein [Dactylosporangium sp. AC04546]WVK80191.1 FtsX-like permease family protein [Dactylosporangium sp. AC04546]